MPIPEAALYAVRDRAGLYAFLRDALHWPVDPEDTFTYPGPSLHAGLEGTVEVSHIVPFAAGDPYALFLVETDRAFRRTDLRDILRAVREKIRREGSYGGKTLDNILFVVATEKYGGVRFVRFEERPGRSPRLSAFGWDREQRDGTRTLRDVNLAALAMPPANAQGEYDWQRARWAEAWDVEKVTKDFFREYREAFEGLMEAVEGVRGDRRLWTQRLCNRLMFTQFLAKKGWLNRDRAYLRTLYQTACDRAARPGVRASARANFYAEFLQPLFFKALNTPTAERIGDAEWSALSTWLGDVPFLNGGLFARQDDDDAPDAVTIPNDAFAPLLDLFDRFNFTLTESTPDDVEVAVDPEMLGKVFEELVTADERHGTGSYYTPRGIVAFMCREALKGYLAGALRPRPPLPQAGEGESAVARFVDEGDPGGLRDPEAVLEALKQVTVCDPACGSGAYLLGMMQELLRLRQALFAAKRLDAGTVYQRKLEIIQRNLYGVDREPFAVNIAMLRLWLSLVVDDERNPLDDPSVDVSLPNLRFKIQQGDALAAPMPDLSSLTMFGEAYAEDAARLRALHDEYFAPPHPSRPKRPKEAIERDIEATQEEIEKLLDRPEDQPGLDWHVRFAEVFASGPPDPLKGEVRTPPSPLKGEQTVTAYPLTGEPPVATVPPLGGQGVGGFDIVLANPPYVRQELIREQKPALQKAFPEVYTGTADLYVFFYARALQLLREGGMLVFISSNKWFRAAYGAKLRAHMAAVTDVRSITDFGELPVFQSAATFPMILVTRKCAPEGGAPVFTQVKTLEPPYPDVLTIIREQGERLPTGALSGAAWTLTGAAAADRLRKMERAGIPLGEYVNGAIYYGVKTGFNTAFVIDGAKRDELIQRDPKSAEIIKPLAVGDDVRRWRIERRDRWLIFARRGIDINTYPAVKSHLAQWRKQLEPRPRDWDTENGEWPGRKPGSYKWCEIQDEVAYFREFDRPKVVYPEICKERRFSYDHTGTFVNNKGFIMPTDDLYLLGVLNSEPAWTYAKSICAALGNEEDGGRLMLQWVNFSRLPIADASTAARAAVSALVQKCLDARGVGCEAWEKEIDERVAALYGL